MPVNTSDDAVPGDAAKRLLSAPFDGDAVSSDKALNPA
jgi:hypothetical protein